MTNQPGISAVFVANDDNIPDVHALPRIDGPQIVSVPNTSDKCFCWRPAKYKVEEVILHDDPLPLRHPLTCYLCQKHFVQIMGPAAR